MNYEGSPITRILKSDNKSTLSSAHEDKGDIKLESESESNTRIVSGYKPDKQHPPNPPENITKPDPDEKLMKAAPVSVIDPIVPAAPAGLSIMTGQHFIKHPHHLLY